MTEKDEQKKRILQSAKNLFFKIGYRNLRVDDLARDLGISKKTLYENFQSKEAIVFEIIKDTIEEFNTEIEKIVDKITNAPKELFFYELNKIFDLITSHTNFFTGEMLDDIRKNLPSAMPECEYFAARRKKLFLTIHNIGVEKGMYKETVNPEVLYVAHISIMKGLLHSDVLQHISLSTREVIGSVYDIIFTGILTEDGKESYLTQKK